MQKGKVSYSLTFPFTFLLLPYYLRLITLIHRSHRKLARLWHDVNGFGDLRVVRVQNLIGCDSAESCRDDIEAHLRLYELAVVIQLLRRNLPIRSLRHVIFEGLE